MAKEFVSGEAGTGYEEYGYWEFNPYLVCVNRAYG